MGYAVQASRRWSRWRGQREPLGTLHLTPDGHLACSRESVAEWVNASQLRAWRESLRLEPPGFDPHCPRPFRSG
ncbi:unnamed protein product [Ixodes pacificus]